jgi:hypothetical protein
MIGGNIFMFWNKKRAAEKAVMEITKKIAKLMVYTELAVLATGLPAKEIIKILGEEDLVEAFDNGKLAPYYKDAEKVSVAIDTIAAINQNNNQLDSFATIKTLKEIFNSTAEKIILEVHHTPGPKNNPVMIMHPMMARFLLPKKVLAALELSLIHISEPTRRS